MLERKPLVSGAVGAFVATSVMLAIGAGGVGPVGPVGPVGEQPPPLVGVSMGEKGVLLVNSEGFALFVQPDGNFYPLSVSPPNQQAYRVNVLEELRGRARGK